MALSPDQVIASKYRLVRRLARGGMGSVWQARHINLDVDVALKFLRRDAVADDSADARFKREARAAASLKSPHVVHVHDFGEHEGEQFLAMELLHGEDLRTHLDRVGRLELREATHLIYGVARGLKVAHEAGLVHRDIKPGNLFLSIEGDETIIKILDFGIAKGGGEQGDATTAGMVLGSPGYMSPEQARGGEMDSKSDLWSLAAVYFRMLTGEEPFSGSNAHDTVVKICTEDAPTPSRLLPELGSQVDAFFRRALQRDVEHRLAPLDDWIAEASALIDEEPWGTSGRASLPSLTGTSAPVGRTEETVALPESGPAPTTGSAGGRGAATAHLPRATSAHDGAIEEQPSSSSRGRLIAALLGGALVAASLFWWSGQANQESQSASGAQEADEPRAPSEALKREKVPASLSNAESGSAAELPQLRNETPPQVSPPRPLRRNIRQQ